MATIKSGDIMRAWTLPTVGNAIITEIKEGELRTAVFGDRELIDAPYYGPHPDERDSLEWDEHGLAVLRGYYK